MLLRAPRSAPVPQLWLRNRSQLPEQTTQRGRSGCRGRGRGRACSPRPAPPLRARFRPAPASLESHHRDPAARGAGRGSLRPPCSAGHPLPQAAVFGAVSQPTGGCSAGAGSALRQDPLLGAPGKPESPKRNKICPGPQRRLFWKACAVICEVALPAQRCPQHKHGADLGLGTPPPRA